jgi:hypothetical protein
MSRRTAAHRAQHPRFTLRSLGTSAAALLAAIVLSVSAAGGTYAYLSSAQSVTLTGAGATTATITAGTATLTVGTEAITLAGLYPGETRTTPVAVGNSGTTALALSLDGITGPTSANGLTAAVAPGSCPGTAPGVTAGPLGLALPAGATGTVCLAIGMATSAPAAAQNSSSTVTIALTGTQS